MRRWRHLVRSRRRDTSFREKCRHRYTPRRSRYLSFFGGVLRSADGGVTWTNPVANAAAFGLSKDPDHRGVLWAAGVDYSTGLATVWKSRDFGATWSSQTPDAFNPTGPSGVFAYGIAVQPGTGRIFANWSGRDPNTFMLNGGMVVSVDGGQTWTNVGLPSSEHISKIIVDPTDGNTVYVCAPGRLWSDSAERGLYKTSDGGKSWIQVLKGPNLSTGCSTIAMDPKDPKVIFAGLWDFRRKGWTFRSGGEGPDAPSGSALMRSADGGQMIRYTATGECTKPAELGRNVAQVLLKRGAQALLDHGHAA